MARELYVNVRRGLIQTNNRTSPKEREGEEAMGTYRGLEA
jgi:hypothetical protein